MFKRLSAALLAGPLLVGLIPVAASAAPAERTYRSFDHSPRDHHQCMYRCEERFGHDYARHDHRDGAGGGRDRWGRDRWGRDRWGRDRWGRDRWGRDRWDRDRYDRRRYDRCRYGRCDDRIYHEGKCWYHDGDRWRRCRSRDRDRDRYRYRS